MSKPSPALYCTTNWSSYTASLKKRGSLLLWLDKEMTWLAPHDGRPGRPSVFSDAAVQFYLTAARQGIAQQCPRGDQGPVQAAVAADDRQGGQPV